MIKENQNLTLHNTIFIFFPFIIPIVTPSRRRLQAPPHSKPTCLRRWNNDAGPSPTVVWPRSLSFLGIQIFSPGVTLPYAAVSFNGPSYSVGLKVEEFILYVIFISCLHRYASWNTKSEHQRSNLFNIHCNLEN